VYQHVNANSRSLQVAPIPHFQDILPKKKTVDSKRRNMA